MSPAVSPIPFEDFVARLLACYAEPLRAPATLSKMRQVMSDLAKAPGLSTTADLTTATVAWWISERSKTVCPNTIDGELGYVAAACAHAVEEGWLARNPCASKRLRVRPEPPAGKTHHAAADVAKVLAHLRGRSGDSWQAYRLYAAASTVAYTGLRRSEALNLHAEDVLLPEGILLVVARRRLKTAGAAQPVPLPPRLAEVLSPWLPRCGCAWLFPNGRRTGPWVGGNHGYRPLDRLKAAGEACGVAGFTWRSLRHSWATHAESRWGLGEAAIQRVLRHTRPLTQLRYRHADAANLRAIGERVCYADC